MIVPLSWLKDHIEVTEDIEALENKLNLTGTAVESVREIKPGYSGVMTGKIQVIEPHPNADNLVLCQVDVGDRQLSIVCGAKNMKVGDIVAVAVEGAVLKDGFKIKRSKIRGVESNGMLCSEAELGIADSADGILILEKKTPLGVELEKVIDGCGDHIIEFEIMPNRPDCLSVIGIAREIKAIYGKKIQRHEPKIVESATPTSSQISVQIIDPDLCQRYSARIINGIKVEPSPQWLKDRLEKVGIRSINNVVDVTNYVMWDTGQPLHAFDLGKLKGSKIVVRRAKKGEQIVCLDEVTRTLDKDTLVIADAKRAVAVAGIMGGADTEVDSQTVDILIESASFKRQNIMTKSKLLGMFTESSRRFERGVDPSGTVYAANRCVELIKQLAGGAISKGIIDVQPAPVQPITLKLRVQRVTDILGIGIKATQMITILKGLDMEIVRSTGKEIEGNLVLEVRVPTFRVDIEREIDLIEEVARFYGYENITSTLPASRKRAGKLTDRQKFLSVINRTMTNFGLSQASNLSFSSDTTDLKELLDSHILHEFIRNRSNFKLHDLKRSIGDRSNHSEADAIRIRNPLSSEFSYLRQSLLPALLKNIVFNKNRGINNVQLYEIGKSYIPDHDNSLPNEYELLSFALHGSWSERNWHLKNPVIIDIFDGKGLVDEIFADLNIRKYRFQPMDCGLLNPARSIEIIIGAGTSVGFVGEIHPEIAGFLGLSPRVTLGEILLDKLLERFKDRQNIDPISKFPSVKFDIAFLVDDNVTNDNVVALLKKFGGKDLSLIRLFDEYKDSSLPKNKKSLAYTLEFQSMERTLTDEDIKKRTDDLIMHISKELKAKLRI